MSERTDPEKRPPMIPTPAPWSDFFTMGGYTLYAWFAATMSVTPLVVLVLHSALQHRAILRGVAQWRAREARVRATQM